MGENENFIFVSFYILSSFVSHEDNIEIDLISTYRISNKFDKQLGIYLIKNVTDSVLGLA